jgi:hypothetical protein
MRRKLAMTVKRRRRKHANHEKRKGKIELWRGRIIKKKKKADGKEL